MPYARAALALPPLRNNAMSAYQTMRSYFSRLEPNKPDTEFMPEVDGSMLEDSPTLTRITIWLTCLLLIAVLVWAKFAVLEEVTMGEGKAIPSSKGSW